MNGLKLSRWKNLILFSAILVLMLGQAAFARTFQGFYYIELPKPDSNSSYYGTEALLEFKTDGSYTVRTLYNNGNMEIMRFPIGTNRWDEIRKTFTVDGEKADRPIYQTQCAVRKLYETELPSQNVSGTWQANELELILTVGSETQTLKRATPDTIQRFLNIPEQC